MKYTIGTRTMLALVNCALLAAGCGKVHVTFGDTPAPTPPMRTTPATVVAVPEAPVRGWKPYDLVAVRGVVGERVRGGYIIEPMPAGTIRASSMNYHLPGTAGAGDSLRMARQAAEEEKRAYGPLLVVKGSELEATSNATAREVHEAVIALTGAVNLKKGAMVSLLLGPMNERGSVGPRTLRVYSANCGAAAVQSGNWMWERRSQNPLERGAF